MNGKLTLPFRNTPNRLGKEPDCCTCVCTQQWLLSSQPLQPLRSAHLCSKLDSYYFPEALKPTCSSFMRMWKQSINSHYPDICITNCLWKICKEEVAGDESTLWGSNLRHLHLMLLYFFLRIWHKFNRPSVDLLNMEELININWNFALVLLLVLCKIIKSHNWIQ